MHIQKMGQTALIAVLIFIGPALAFSQVDEGIEDVYLTADAFLAEAFDGEIPAPQKFWVTKAYKAEINQILGRDLGVLRVAFWRRGDRTAWILEEIGKVKPITTGLVVDGGTLARLAVLIYRESRGWEVRHDFFTDQFRGARLVEPYKLDRPIDGISGATLSVRALTRLAQLALYLHSAVVAQP
jgi:hypothetical protein